MTPREWFVLALRVLAIALFVLLVMQVMTLAILVSDGGGNPVLTSRAWLVALADAVVAVVLFRVARWAGDRVYGRPAPRAPLPSSGATPADAFVVGCRLLGVYALYSAVEPLAALWVRLVRGDADPFSFVDWRMPAAKAGGYLAFGVILIVGPKWFGRRIRGVIDSVRISDPGP